jgi:hypothetical protein
VLGRLEVSDVDERAGRCKVRVIGTSVNDWDDVVRQRKVEFLCDVIPTELAFKRQIKFVIPREIRKTFDSIGKIMALQRSAFSVDIDLHILRQLFHIYFPFARRVTM